MAILQTWPSSLPRYFRRPNFGEGPFAPRYEYPTDAGRPIEIPMMTVRLVDLGGSMIMTNTQFQLFEDFVWFDLRQGVDEFLFPRPRTEDLLPAVMLGNSGRPYQLNPISGVEMEVSFKLRMTIP